MTILAAITRADELRPNTFSDDLKAEWLLQVEGEIAEMMNVDQPTINADFDQELLMPYPHDGFYVPYLCACIDEANEESELFADDMTIANQTRQECCAWWWRNNPPRMPIKYVKGI